MKSISTAVVAVVLAAGSTYAMAQQSKSNVNVDNVIQGGAPPAVEWPAFENPAVRAGFHAIKRSSLSEARPP